MSTAKFIRKPKHDLTGRRFGKLTAITFSHFAHGAVWLCKCDCGSYSLHRTDVLRSNDALSCGCDRYRNCPRTHGKKGTKIYATWLAMIQRCTNPNVHNFADYGGRGICVFPAWMKFEHFYAAVGDPPTQAHSLDRYPNPNGDYEPGNVRWATRSQQQRNKRNTIWLTFKDQTKSVAEWAEIVGILASTIHSRLGRGWPAEIALTRPTRFS